MNHFLQNNGTTISVSSVTLLKILTIGLALWVAYLTFDILILVVAALFLAAALYPTVNKLERLRIPRSLSMLVIYLILLFALASVTIIVLPQITAQFYAIAHNFPLAYASLISWLTSLGIDEGLLIAKTTENINATIASATHSAVQTVADIFNGIFSVFMILIMTFYLVVDKASAKRTVSSLPAEYQKRAVGLYNRLSFQLGRWLRAQILLMIIVGLLTYLAILTTNFVAVTFFELPAFEYALSLALVAGVLEFIPYLGPMLSAIPAVLLAFAISPSMALVILFIYWLIQMIEGNILTPKIMQRAVGLSPIVSIVVFLIGARLAGLAGAFLAIPIATAIAILIKDLYTNEFKPIKQ